MSGIKLNAVCICARVKVSVHTIIPPSERVTCLDPPDKSQLMNNPRLYTHLILVTTATTGGDALFSSQRTFSTKNVEGTKFVPRI